jgi:hypothetical protein
MRVLGVVAFAAGLLLMLRSAFPMDAGVDYFSDASAAIDALARGDLDDFFHQTPLMGSFSLLLRAPFVKLVFHSSLDAVYFAGVLPCLAAVGGLAYALRRRMTALGRPAAAITLVTVVALLNTGVFRSVHWGHPEEILGGALCAGAVLAGLRDRSLLAGLLLGLAVATKQWAVIAVIPTLLATSQRRIALLLVAGAVGGALTLPSYVVKPATFVAVHKEAALAGGPVGPPNVWMPFASKRSEAAREAASQGFAYEIPAWLSGLTHPVIVLAGIPLGLLFWRRRRTLEREDALGLLALLLLIRCIADPWNNDYYHAPFLLALLSWEALARDGWPRLTVFAGAALAATFPATLVTMSQMSAEPLRYCLGYLVWALPLTAWLALSLFAPARAAAITAAVRSRLPGRLERAANVAHA